MSRVRVVTAILLLAGVVSLWNDARASHFKKLSRKDVRARSEKLSPRMVREVAGIQYLLRPDELAALLADPEDARCQRWIDAWWVARDPVYTTPHNEARNEHEHRVDVAEQYFGRGAWPGWDDRGEVYIRYGAPGSYSHSPAEVSEPGVYIPAQDYWYYPQFDMYARFADPTGAGRYFLFLEGVQAPVGERPRSDRRNLASKHNPDRPMDYMTVDADPLWADDLYPPFAEKHYDDFMKRVYRYYDVLEENPVVYSFDYATMRVPMCFAVQSFRGGEGVDRVDVSAEFEANVTVLSDTLSTRRFVTTAVFWDGSGRELARNAHTDTVGVSALFTDSVCTVVNQTTLTLPPGTYRMAVTVQEDGTGRFTSLKRTVGCQDMAESPAMSDLALAREIGPALETSPFNRGPLRVVPRPSGSYRLGASVPVYFEVYNLGRDGDGAYAYTVEYAITPKNDRPQSFWKRLVSGAEAPIQVRSRFDAAAAGPDDVVHVLASTHNLWPGEYALAVTVTDRASSRRVVRNTTFRLRE